MFPEKERIESLLEDALKELDLLQMMSSDIRRPYDFVSNLSGLTAFRACGMSLQYITEIFVKIRNLCGKEFFNPYSSINWNAVFGMRNFLSHEHGDIDNEGNGGASSGEDFILSVHGKSTILDLFDNCLYLFH